jgi:hypothetical protein
MTTIKINPATHTDIFYSVIKQFVDIDNIIAGKLKSMAYSYYYFYYYPNG